MIANIFEGKTRTNYWEKSDQKDGDYKALITNILPRYQASFTLELTEQHFIVKDIFPLKADIGNQGLQLHQPIDLTSSIRHKQPLCLNVHAHILLRRLICTTWRSSPSVSRG